MNPQALQQQIDSLISRLDALESSSTIPRNVETAFKKRLFIQNVTIGIAVPATTPVKVGDVFIDTVNKKVYYGMATSSSSSWVILN